MQEPLIYVVFIVMILGELQSILQIDGSMNISVFSFVAVAESQTVKTTESLNKEIFWRYRNFKIQLLCHSRRQFPAPDMHAAPSKIEDRGYLL